MLNYNDFQEVTVTTNRMITFKTSTPSYSQKVQVYNDLDYATFRIMTMKSSQFVIAATQHTHTLCRSARLANKQVSIDSQPFLTHPSLHITDPPTVSCQKKPDFIVCDDHTLLTNLKATKESLLPRVITKSTFLKII